MWCGEALRPALVREWIWPGTDFCQAGAESGCENGMMAFGHDGILSLCALATSMVGLRWVYGEVILMLADVWLLVVFGPWSWPV